MSHLKRRSRNPSCASGPNRAVFLGSLALFLWIRWMTLCTKWLSGLSSALLGGSLWTSFRVCLFWGTPLFRGLKGDQKESRSHFGGTPLQTTLWFPIYPQQEPQIQIQTSNRNHQLKGDLRKQMSTVRQTHVWANRTPSQAITRHTMGTRDVSSVKGEQGRSKGRQFIPQISSNQPRAINNLAVYHGCPIVPVNSFMC